MENTDEPVVDEDVDPFRVELTEPVQAHGETLTHLQLQAPKMKHLRARDGAKGPTDASIRVMSVLAGVPPSTIDELTPVDFAAAEAVLRPFFAGLEEPEEPEEPEDLEA